MIERNRESITLQPRAYDALGLPSRYFNPGELSALLHLFESVQARTIVEFGVHAGRNPAAAFRNLSTVQKYVGVDVPHGYNFKMRIQRNEVPQIPGQLVRHDRRFQLILRPRGSFDLMPKDLPRADAVFIDGDHSREAVLNDYALACAITRPGGIVIFHDDNGSDRVEVTQTLNELTAQGAKIQHVAGTWLSFEIR